MASTQPVTQVLLSIDKVLQDAIITDSGLKLYLNPDYKREWNVATTAKICALPLKVNPKDKKILDSLKVGDEVAISYQVVYDLEFKGDGHRFMPSVDDDRYVKEFVNGKGETVRVYGLAKRSGFKGLTWIGTYQNKKREVIDGVQGDEETVERWLSQFPLGKTDDYSFNNFFEYSGQDYWKCYPDEIFAKKVKGHWVAISDRVICSPIDEDVPRELLNQIKHKETVKIRRQDRATVLSGGKRMNLKKGDIVSFDPQKVEKYKLGNKDYYLINERLINGKWN